MLVLLLSLLACDSPSVHAPPVTRAEHPHETPAPTATSTAEPVGQEAHVAHGTGSDAPALVMDGTAKWKTDAHTREVMAEIRSSVAAAQVADGAQAAALADTLQGQVDKLIAGCTMQGAAHAQLHTFLGAFIPAIAELKTAGEPAAKVDKLRALVRQYDQFFE